MDIMFRFLHVAMLCATALGEYGRDSHPPSLRQGESCPRGPRPRRDSHHPSPRQGEDCLEVLDGFEVIEVLDRETPVLEVLDRFEVIEVLDSDTETPVLEAPDGAIRVRQGFQPVPPRLIFQPVLPLPSRG